MSRSVASFAVLAVCIRGPKSLKSRQKYGTKLVMPRTCNTPPKRRNRATEPGPKLPSGELRRLPRSKPARNQASVGEHQHGGHRATGLKRRFGPAGLTWNDGSTPRFRGECSAAKVQSRGVGSVLKVQARWSLWKLKAAMIWLEGGIDDYRGDHFIPRMVCAP